MNRLQEILNNLRRNTTYTLINALGSYKVYSNWVIIGKKLLASIIL